MAPRHGGHDDLRVERPVLVGVMGAGGDAWLRSEVAQHPRMMMDLACTAGAVARLRPSARGLAVSRAVDSVTTGRQLCSPIMRNSTPTPCSGWCSVVV